MEQGLTEVTTERQELEMCRGGKGMDGHKEPERGMVPSLPVVTSHQCHRQLTVPTLCYMGCMAQGIPGLGCSLAAWTQAVSKEQ